MLIIKCHLHGFWWRTTTATNYEHQNIHWYFEIKTYRQNNYSPSSNIIVRVISYNHNYNSLSSIITVRVISYCHNNYNPHQTLMWELYHITKTITAPRQRLLWELYYSHLLCLRRTTAKSGQLAHMITNILTTITKTLVLMMGGDRTSW